MKEIMNMWRCNIIFLLLIGSCSIAFGQNVAFIASPSASKMGVKDQVQVTFTVKNVDGLTDLHPNGFGDFTHIAGPFQSQSVNITNNNRSISVSLTYVLVPRHEGKLTIPPATAKDANGHTYQSNAVTIEVFPGSMAPAQPARRQMPGRSPFDDDEDDMFAMMQQQMAQMNRMHQQMMQQMYQQQPRGAQPTAPQQAQPQANAPVNSDEIKKDLFIKVTVDKNKVNVGDQITASYKLYSRVPMQVSISKLPSLNGFWTQDFEIPKQPKPTEEVINGKKYQVFLLKKSALFPQQTGTLELDPAEATGVARIVQQVRRKMSDMFASPFGRGTLMMNDPFFDNAFFDDMMYKDVNVNLQSTPVKITVLPLPDKNKPSDFGGAVGKFTISSKIDKENITTDDVVNFSITINGSGNLKLIEAPKLNLPNGISTYDPQIIDSITSRTTTISGYKTLTYAITPQTAGDFTIPAIPFTYYDPSKGTYITLNTTPVTLHVKPGKGGVAKTTTTKLNLIKDIHDINASVVSHWEPNALPYFYTNWYWILIGTVVAGGATYAGWKKYNDAQSSNTVKLRNKRANKIALQRLATAQKLMQKQQDKQFYEEISKAIWLYLSDKLFIPLSAMSKDVAISALHDRGVTDAALNNFNSVIWECETALYASGGAKKMNQTYEEAIKVISDFEELIKEVKYA